MRSRKLTHHKERSFACNNFPFSKILFQFRNLVYRVDLTYQPTKCLYSYFSKALEFYLRVFLSLWASLKVVSATFLLDCFVCLKESTCETRKNTFYFTSKALLVLDIINLDIQMSWRHQKPKHETQNIHYWITW